MRLFLAVAGLLGALLTTRALAEDRNALSLRLAYTGEGATVFAGGLRKAYLATKPQLPDWRINCFFSGKGNRGRGIAAAALQGSLDQIAALGGGRVEGYPEETEGRKVSPAFLFNGSLSTFERFGFERSRLIGKHKWVVTRHVPRQSP